MAGAHSLTFYELQQQRKLRHWQKRLQARPGRMSIWSKRLQNRFNRMIPQQVHDTITTIIRKVVEGVLLSSNYLKPVIGDYATLEEREKAILKRLDYYRTTAAAEGGITGMGGVISAMADFPALLAIKLKFLHDLAELYGHDTTRLGERIFLLKVFQLAFSNPERRTETYEHIAALATGQLEQPHPDAGFEWYHFQQDYRDYLDVAKLLQMIPVVGAAVGVVVNYRLLNQLCETAMMCYRMRWLANVAK